MRCTLIGGSGFIGTRLIECLRATHDVRNIDLRHSQAYDDCTAIGDVRDEARLTELLQGTDTVILLAAEHHDNVTPHSLYYDVNVNGMKATLAAMEKAGVRHIVFFSTVAVYGLNLTAAPDEKAPCHPFNHYGRSKYEAEQLLEKWTAARPDRSACVIRPSVVFGEDNRGNVYNLLHLLASPYFMMIGKGRNKKSMAYVGNIVEFVSHLLDNVTEGYQVFNYADSPDLTMRQLVDFAAEALGRTSRLLTIPRWLAVAGGHVLDTVATLMGRKFPISAVRIRKFCTTTRYDTTKAARSGFTAPFSLRESLQRTITYEFGGQKTN